MLPMMSQSYYDASVYRDFLFYKNRGTSQYINATQGFVDTQSYFGLNSTLLFAQANLESAYGTSRIAKACNNFFGRAAYDSNPGNACDTLTNGVYFADPYQGILAQGDFQTRLFADIYD